MLRVFNTDHEEVEPGNHGDCIEVSQIVASASHCKGLDQQRMSLRESESEVVNTIEDIIVSSDRNKVCRV
jgi:hypothetical protein